MNISYLHINCYQELHGSIITRQASLISSNVLDLITGPVTTLTHVIVPVQVFPSDEKEQIFFFFWLRKLRCTLTPAPQQNNESP